MSTAAPAGVIFARWPQTDDELWEFIATVFGVKVPRTSVCKGHSNPFAALTEAFFARAPLSVWKASRGFGGKSFTLALLSNLESMILGAQVSLLGGSGAQSKNVLAYNTELWSFEGAPADLLASELGKEELRFRNGGRIRALMASQKSVRGPHPTRLHLDEADELELAILDAALGQPMSKDGIQAQTTISSTHQYPDGTMTEMLRRAAERGYPVHEWCWKETSAPHGWLSPVEVETKRGVIPKAMWETEYDLGEPNPKGRVIDTDKVKATFKKELGDFEGSDGEYIEIEAPIANALYASGADWAKEQDFTEIKTLRIDVDPYRLVASERMHKLPWPVMAQKLDKRLRRYPGPCCHDNTGLGDVVADLLYEAAQPVNLQGRARRDLFSNYIAAIENDELEGPFIRTTEAEHRYLTKDEVYGSGHPPDSFVAMALAYKAASEGGRILE